MREGVDSFSNIAVSRAGSLGTGNFKNGDFSLDLWHTDTGAQTRALNPIRTIFTLPRGGAGGRIAEGEKKRNRFALRIFIAMSIVCERFGERECAGWKKLSWTGKVNLTISTYSWIYSDCFALTARVHAWQVRSENSKAYIKRRRIHRFRFSPARSEFRGSSDELWNRDNN